MAIYRGLGGSGTTSDTAALDEITINAQEAAQSATDAASSASASATSATNSANSATASATSASESADSAAAALVSEVNAAASENAAATSETNAATSETNAATSAANAAASETAAASSASDAQTAQTAAEAAQTAAENAQAATETLFDQFGDQYLGSLASDPTVDNDGDPLNEGDVYWNSTDNVLKFYSGTAWVAPEDIATTAATNASNSAAAAATSESNAATSATNAETSYQNTLAIYGNTQDVANAVAAAQSAQTGAETAETNAGNSAIAADASANDAATSEVNAAASETAAAGSAASASTSATASANSATAASASATAAATSETNAATSATNAATSATASANSATASAASATSAANSAAAAAASLDNFDDRYLGAKASDPTLDNDGNPLVTGALYFNTTDTVMKIWEGTMWIAAASAQLAAFAKFAYTATAGQTVFSGSDDNANTLALTVDTEIVMLNGVVLEQDTDYTATTTSITLTSGAASGDELNVFAFGSFQVADTVSKSLGGTFDAGVNVLGNVGIGTSSPSFTAGSNGVMISGTKPSLRLSSLTTGSGTWEIYADSATSGGLGFYERQNNATMMYVDEGGRVTMPYQPMYASSGAPTLSNGTSSGSVFIFNGSYINVGSHYNTGSGRFTAPVSGYYELSYNIGYYTTGSTVIRDFRIQTQVNDANYLNSCFSAANNTAGNDHGTWSRTQVIHLNAGDSTRLIVSYSQNGSGLYMDSACDFNIKLIG